MSKRKKNDPTPDEEEEDDDDDSQDKSRQQAPPQKTTEVYPERLRELNHQFTSSISSQITSEPYTVLVGNCLDYVRQFFIYEDDLLKYSPWLATRVKQSRSDIVQCLQNTIDIYDALARHDFDSLFDKNTTADDTANKTDAAAATPSFQFRPPATTGSSVPLFSFTKSTTAAPAETTPTASFSFKMPTSTTIASPEKTANTSPFSFSMANSGFGTSTFNSPSFGTPTSTEKTSTASASSISFAPPPKFSFGAPTPTVTGDQQGATEENEDEPNEPPEPEKVNHETDAKLTYRCRMGVNKSGKLIKRGPVQVILKEAGDKHQLIVRSDDALGRLYLNLLWSKQIELKKNSTKDLTFVCKLNPGMPEIKEGEFVMILLRFDNETDRNDAHDKLEKEQT